MSVILENFKCQWEMYPSLPEELASHGAHEFSRIFFPFDSHSRTLERVPPSVKTACPSPENLYAHEVS
jgi:hypothetical protein